MAVVLSAFTQERTEDVAMHLTRHFFPAAPGAWSRTLNAILWDNPNRTASAAAGWVLLDDDAVVGFLGNVVHPYSIAGEAVQAAATTAWSVSPEHRSRGLLLADAFFGQSGVDILFNTTANQAAGEVFRRMGAVEVPVPWFRDILYWRGRPSAFIRGGAAHITGSRFVAVATGAVCLPADKVLRLFNRSNAVLKCNDADFTSSEWNDFWSRTHGALNTGVRSTEQLLWRSSSPNVLRKQFQSNSGEVVGCCLARVVTDHGGLLRRLRVLDIWLPDCGFAHDVVSCLRDLADEHSCAVVEFPGGSRALRDALRECRPRIRTMASMPYFVRLKRKSLAKAFADTEAWHATEYDGDSSFGVYE